MRSRSNYEHEPAEEQVEEDDRIQRQFSLALGNHLSHKGYWTLIYEKVHKVAHRKLATTMASLKMGGSQLSMKTMEKEATLMGNKQ
jgi:hypothetical protein